MPTRRPARPPPPLAPQAQISTQKRRTGVIAPKRFVARVKKDNELFRSFMHQAPPAALPRFSLVVCLI